MVKKLTAIHFITCCLVCCSGITQKHVEFPSKIYYETYGYGNPLLLINGGPGYSSEGFRPLAQALADSLRCRVIIFDQRGTGRSKLDSLSAKTITMDLMVEDIENLRKELNIDQWVVMGHSFGGMLAAFYASKHRKTIKAMILSSSGGLDLSSLNSEGILSRLSQTQLDSMLFWNSRISQGDTNYNVLYQWAKNLAPAYIYNDKYVPIVAERLTQGNRAITTLVINDLREIGYDLKDPLRDFKQPVLIIQGKYDVIPIETAKQTHNILPNSELTIIDSCSHYGWLDQRGVYFNKIKNFMNKGIRS